MAHSQTLPDPSDLESSEILRFASTEGKRSPLHAHHAPAFGFVERRERGAAAVTPAGDSLIFVGGSGHYRLGDLLRPLLVKNVFGVSQISCAGLAERDFSAYGGEPLRRYDDCAGVADTGNGRLHILHHGGDLLAGNLFDRYACVASEDEVERFASLREIGDDAMLRAYIERRSGFSGPWPSLLEAEGEFFGAQVGYLGVGFSDLNRLSRAESKDLVHRLGEARFLGVREAAAADWLETQGLAARRMPCPLSILPDHAGRELDAAKRSDALASMRRRFPDGWIAVEIGSVPPASKDRLLDTLQQVAEDASLGLVFFDASHDGLGGTEDRCAWWTESLGEFSAARFPSKQVWEVAAMLLGARLYCGWNLDCRALAIGGGVPRLELPGANRSHRGYTALWEDESVVPVATEKGDWSKALSAALSIPPALLERHATRVRGACYEAFAACREACGIDVPAEGAEATEEAEVPSAASRPGRLAASSQEHRNRAARLRHLHDEWLEKAAAWPHS